MLGLVRMIENEEARFGADPWYFFAKVQSPHKEEEYWLVTEEEADLFASRVKPVSTKPELTPLGHFRWDALNTHWVIAVESREMGRMAWRLTPRDLQRIRERVGKNQEDIAANQESWLADLFD